VWPRLDVEVRCDIDVGGRILPMAKAYVGISYPVPTWAAPRAENVATARTDAVPRTQSCQGGCRRLLAVHSEGPRHRTFYPTVWGSLRLESPDRKCLGRTLQSESITDVSPSLLPSLASPRADGRVRGLLVARPTARGSMLNARCPLQTRYSKPAPDSILGRCWNVAAKRTRRAFATQSCRWGAPGSRRSKTARSGDEVTATTQAMACRCAATWQCAIEVPRQSAPRPRIAAPGRLFVARRGGPSVQDAILSHFDSNFHTRLDRDVKCHRPTWSSATGPAWISEQHLRQSPPQCECTSELPKNPPGPASPVSN
jgi:hypothetical protein